MEYMGQCLVDPKAGELGSKYSCLNMKRKMTTRSKQNLIHVKAESHTDLKDGSKPHVITDRAPPEMGS